MGGDLVRSREFFVQKVLVKQTTREITEEESSQNRTREGNGSESELMDFLRSFDIEGSITVNWNLR